MWDHPLLLEIEYAQRRDEAKRRASGRRLKPSPPNRAGPWRRHFAERLVAFGLWLDPAATRTGSRSEPVPR